MIDAGVRKALEDLLSLKQRTAEGITRRKPTVAATSGFLTKKVSLDGLLMNLSMIFSTNFQKKMSAELHEIWTS